MPIVQERLIKLIEITERAINVTRIHKLAAQKFLDQFHETISDKLHPNDREIVRAFLTSFANIIIEEQMSVEDFMTFREEQIHFKYTQKRNHLNRKYQQRHRARVRMRDSVREEEILYAEEYAALNNAIAEPAEPTEPEQEIEAHITEPTEERGAVIRDEAGVGDKPIRGIISRSNPSESEKQ